MLPSVGSHTSNHMQETRKLSTILFADIAGYTALMQKDEGHAMALLNTFKETLENVVPARGGSIDQYFGDGCLVSFESCVSGVKCAMDLQEKFIADGVPMRMGMHLGDVVFKNNNVFGDGVNIASRIESLGVSGSVLISKSVRDQVKNHPELQLVSVGHFHFKNVDDRMEVFALSNPGLVVPRRQDMKGKLETRGRPKRPVLIGLLLAVVFAAIGGVIWGSLRGGFGSKDIPRVQSLAIMPFFNQSANPDLNPLGEGIAENLIQDMASSTDLRVISRYSTFPLKDSVQNLSYIMQLLGVDAILVGNLDEEEDHYTLNAELVSGTDQAQIWSSRFRVQKDKVPQLESEISTALRTRLEPANKPSERRAYQPDPEAYKHYMQGRFLSFGTTREERGRALQHFYKAIEIDPGYALPYAAVANQKAGQARFSNTSRDELLREARLALNSALSIDPDLPEAHLAEANMLFYSDFNWTGAEAAYKQALSEDPNNARILADYAFFLCCMNRYDRALELARDAVRLDPISISSLHIIAWTKLYDYPEEAIGDFNRITELYPNWIWGYMKQGMAEILSGDCAAGMRSMDRVVERKGEWGGELLEVYLSILWRKCGEIDKAEEKFEEVLAHAEEHGVSDPINIAVLHFSVGDFEEGIKWVEKGKEEKSLNTAQIKLVNGLDFFESDLFTNPLFRASIAQMDFPD